MTMLSSIRQAVKATRRSMRGFESQVVHDHGLSRTSSGRITFAHSDYVTAFVEPSEKKFTKTDGTETAATTRLTFLFSLVIDASDRITLLPSGETGPILKVVEGFVDAEDEAGCGLTVTVYLG